MESVYNIGDKVIVTGRLVRCGEYTTGKMVTWETEDIDPFNAIYVGWSIKVNGLYMQESFTPGSPFGPKKYSYAYILPTSTIRVARVKKSARGNDIMVPFSHIKHFSDEIDILK